MKTIFSGVQPSGVMHIGNYLGAIKQWVELQKDPENDLIFCVVDLHAITVPQDPKILKEKILEVAALYLACGIDPQKPARSASLPEVATSLQAGSPAGAGGSKIFVQSSRPEHAELAWILNCHTGIGELNRMTQYKDKSEKQNLVSAGLFDYPVLMAADILLYKTTHVPVGDDQKQHVELTRDLAIRINNKYGLPAGRHGDIFTVPEVMIKKESARIMGLDDPTKKMSKSAESVNSYIALTDDPETVRQKIKRAVTDSGNEVKAGPLKPAITNMLNIYSGISGKTLAGLESDFSGKSYGEFKDALAEELINFLSPIQQKYAGLMSDKAGMVKILEEGSEAVAPIAYETLKKVKRAVGLGL